MNTFDGPSIVTTNWSHYHDLTEPWLEGIARYVSDPKEVIIVDQGSKRIDVAALRDAEQAYPFLKVIYLDYNSGFPEGNNIGFREATGEYIVCINNDIVFHGDWWTGLRRRLETHSKKALIGPLMNRDTGWNTYIVDDIKITIPYIEGWLLIGHRTMLDDIGYFDPEFGTGSVEDIDYSYRASEAGYDLLDCGSVPMTHLRMKTVTDGRLDYYNVTLRNQQYFAKKIRAAVP